MDRVRAHEHPAALGLEGFNCAATWHAASWHHQTSRQPAYVLQEANGRSMEAVGRAPVSPSGARAKPLRGEGAWPLIRRPFPVSKPNVRALPATARQAVEKPTLNSPKKSS